MDSKTGVLNSRSAIAIRSPIPMRHRRRATSCFAHSLADKLLISLSNSNRCAAFDCGSGTANKALQGKQIEASRQWYIKSWLGCRAQFNRGSRQVEVTAASGGVDMFLHHVEGYRSTSRKHTNPADALVCHCGNARLTFSLVVSPRLDSLRCLAGGGLSTYPSTPSAKRWYRSTANCYKPGSAISMEERARCPSTPQVRPMGRFAFCSSDVYQHAGWGLVPSPVLSTTLPTHLVLDGVRRRPSTGLHGCQLPQRGGRSLSGPPSATSVVSSPGVHVQTSGSDVPSKDILSKASWTMANGLRPDPLPSPSKRLGVGCIPGWTPRSPLQTCS
ncbi:hypothetical protein LXA43DRAFT_50236 [Ganoderma leucocontextum]|nr:hypothetical protein LXA43DRAFT_50236 [Ganoderma leucocontextum]